MWVRTLAADGLSTWRNRAVARGRFACSTLKTVLLFCSPVTASFAVSSTDRVEVGSTTGNDMVAAAPGQAADIVNITPWC